MAAESFSAAIRSVFKTDQFRFVLFHGKVGKNLVKIHFFAGNGVIDRLYRERELDPLFSGKLGVDPQELAADKELVAGLGEDMHAA